MARRSIVTIGPAGTDVMLDGTGSFDPEGQALDYDWDFDGTPATGETPIVSLALDHVYGVELTVTDPDGNWDTDETTATVLDSIPPDLLCPEDVVTECTGFDGATATFNATASDICDDSST